MNEAIVFSRLRCCVGVHATRLVQAEIDAILLGLYTEGPTVPLPYPFPQISLTSPLDPANVCSSNSSGIELYVRVKAFDGRVLLQQAVAFPDGRKAPPPAYGTA